MNRREALIRLGALMAVGGAGYKGAAETTKSVAAANSLPQPGQPFTIAHITDTHITDAYNSEKWVSECFDKIQSHPAKPKLILHTGDIILDVSGKSVTNVDEVRSALRDAKAKGRHDVLMRVKTANATRYIAVPITGHA